MKQHASASLKRCSVAVFETGEKDISQSQMNVSFTQ